MAFKPRDYQQECIDIINTKESGRYLVALATGLGKTVVATNIKRRGRVLILSHRDELVRQPEKYYDCSFGVEKADEYATDEEVVSASVQTLCKDSRLERWSPDTFYTIIIDEAHHAAAQSYRKILSYFSGAKLVIGLTATPKRGDKVGLDSVFDEIIYAKDIKWGIMNGYLCNLQCLEVNAEYKLDKVKNVGGDYNQGDLEKTLSQQKTIAACAKTYVEKCHERGRHTLIYCVTKKICAALENEICELLPDNEQGKIQVLTGSTPDEERREILDKYMAGEIACIINCMVLTEGTDLPITDAIINMRPTKNASLYAQIVGRGTRLYEGKDYCLVIDMCPAEDSKNRNLCVAPSLFGLDISNLDDKTKERFTEGEDLLSLCDEIEGLCTGLAEAVEIRTHATDIFVSRIADIVKMYKGFGCKKIAEKCESLTKADPDEEGIDFHGLCVSKTANDRRRYTVRPSYTEEVNVSTPDALNRVTVDFNVMDVSKPVDNGQSHYITEMRADKAFALIREYCEIMRPDYRQMWDSDTQDKWRTQPVTQKQEYRLETDSKLLGLPVNSIRTLNKFEASQLIQIIMDIKKENDFKSKFAITEKMSEKQKEAVKKRALKYSENEKEAQKKARGEFCNLEAELARKKVVFDMQKEKAAKRAEERIEKGYYETSVNPWQNRSRATARQISFFKSLAVDLRDKNYCFPDSVMKRLTGLTVQDLSFLISVAKHGNLELDTAPRAVYFTEDSLQENLEMFSKANAAKKYRIEIKAAS